METMRGLLLGVVMLGMAFLLVDVIASSLQSHQTTSVRLTFREARQACTQSKDALSVGCLR